MSDSHSNESLLATFGVVEDANASLAPQWVDDRRASEESAVAGIDDAVAAGDSSSRPSVWSGFLGRFSQSARGAYARLAPGEGGTDGVFGNLVAKDEVTIARDAAHTGTSADMLAEDDDGAPNEPPPTYDEAAADSTPSYWETTIMASGWSDEVLVDELPVGRPLHFAWNVLISAAFSPIGFFITYLFHTTHAARGGSITGLGLTLIQASYSFYSGEPETPHAPPNEFHPNDPNNYVPGAQSGTVVSAPSSSFPSGHASFESDEGRISSSTQSKLVFVLGVLLVLKGVFDYWRATRVKAQILRYQDANSGAASASSANEWESPHGNESGAAEELWNVEAVGDTHPQVTHGTPRSAETV